MCGFRVPALRKNPRDRRAEQVRTRSQLVRVALEQYRDLLSPGLMVRLRGRGVFPTLASLLFAIDQENRPLRTTAIPLRAGTAQQR